MIRAVCVGVLMGLAQPAFSSGQETLAREIEDAATHAFEDERHTVEVDGCQLTTFRWRDRPDHGWVLWTSLKFDMVNAKLSEGGRETGQKYVYALLDKGPPEKGIALVFFTMREGTLARQERSILRERSGETQPSPRGDGTTHYFRDIDDFFFMMQGEGVETKTAIFAAGYEQYIADYCTFTS